MSKSYEVVNPLSGHSFGFYSATSAEDAILTCCQEAGYSSVADAEETIGRKSELRASRIVTIDAKKYEDHDDSLSAAAEEYARKNGLQEWNLSPRWEDNHNRDTIILYIPD